MRFEEVPERASQFSFSIGSVGPQIVKVSEYKRQHFLPCVYLKNFSPDGPRATRNSMVWRLDEKRALLVPVKSQCASDYLFSKTDPRTSEEEFQAIEAGYARAMRKIWIDQPPTSFEYFALILATIDLFTRNVAHENQTGLEGIKAYQFRTFSMLNRLIVGNEASEALPPQEILARVKKNWAVRLLRSPGPELITSDHPVLCFTWGQSSTVSFMLLPVSPAICAVVFDRNATRVSGDTLTSNDGAHLLSALVHHWVECVYVASPPGPEITEFCRDAWKKDRPQPTVTGGEKWTLDLIVPPKPDIFSFLRPLG